jgi:hypothetical protein
MVQTEAQYKFVYLAVRHPDTMHRTIYIIQVQHHIDTLSQRLAAEQKSQLVRRDCYIYTVYTVIQ